MTNVARLSTGTALEAAGYIRVSRTVQADGHSPEVQRDAIKRLATQEGYALTMVEEDHERGSNLTRAGYQRIIEAVRAGTIHAVLVFMFDRWGRDGAEWLTRAREFERLNVPIISVQEGRDAGGLMRFIRAGMAEEYSRQLAQRVRPARERAARQGTHMGPTPYGYKRIYPAWDGKGRRPSGQLVPDEATAWVVREMFTRYASGGWSIRQIASWLNGHNPPIPPPRGTAWNAECIRAILHNVTYMGKVGYNKAPSGLYERSAPGHAFIADAAHSALVDPDTWQMTQIRMMKATIAKSHNRHKDKQPLAVGILRCAVCGGPMTCAHNQHPTHKASYVCLWRGKGRSQCATPGYLADLAHTALLAEIRRLQGKPWTPQAERRLTGPEGQDDAARAASLTRALEQERDRLRRHARRMSDMEDDPTPEVIDAFRQVGREIAARIQHLETQLSEVAERAAIIPDLHTLHERLMHTDIGAVVDALSAQGDVNSLREILFELVQSARVVVRHKARRAEWVRLEVVWSPNIQTLLDAGLLTLADPLV